MYFPWPRIFIFWTFCYRMTDSLSVSIESLDEGMSSSVYVLKPLEINFLFQVQHFSKLKNHKIKKLFSLQIQIFNTSMAMLNTPWVWIKNSSCFPIKGKKLNFLPTFHLVFSLKDCFLCFFFLYLMEARKDLKQNTYFTAILNTSVSIFRQDLG